MSTIQLHSGLKRQLRSLVRQRLKGESIAAQLLRGASVTFFISIIGTALGAIVQVTLARLVGVTIYGQYIYVWSWLTILATLCIVGMDTTIMRFAGSYNGQQAWGLLRGFLRYSYGFTAAALVMSSLITALAVIWILPLDAALRQTFLVACLALPAAGFLNLVGRNLLAFEHVWMASAPMSVFRPILLLAGIGVTLVVLGDITAAWQVIFINVITVYVLLGASGWVLWRALPQGVAHRRAEFALPIWNRMSLQFFYMEVLRLIVQRTDLILIGIFLGTTKAGIYAAATHIIMLMDIGLQAVNTIVAPKISSLYGRGEMQELQRMVTLATMVSSAYSLVVGLGLVVTGHLLLNLFGEAFTTGYGVLVVLSVGRIVNSWTGPVVLLMTMTGHQTVAVKLQAVNAVASVLLNITLIPPFGMIGAALASSSIVVIWNLAMYWNVRQRLKIDPTVFGWFATRP
jgi:O-antigen/teichoic acid export membrane protein